MEDKQIVELYWERSETAISATADKYGRYCHYIAYRILHSDEDSEECVNDTYLAAWDKMPPERPSALKAFLGKLTRNISLNRYDYLTAEKRGGGEIPLALDELAECVGDGTEADLAQNMALTEIINRFLHSLSQENRMIFMRRYWYLSSVLEIADDYKISEGKVKMSLYRSRKKLKQILEKEGISL